MKVVVYPHTMEIGGSQLNAVQLAGAVRDLGHEVIVVSEPGPLVAKVADLGLEHIAIPARRRRPSPEVAAMLRDLVRRRGVDVVHGYEWPPTVEAFLGLGLPPRRCAVVSTVMSMSVVSFLPRTVPLLVGTADIRDAAREAGHLDVALLEPPVDTESDRPGLDGSAFRSAHGIDPGTTLVVTVCRLVPQLKRESLLSTCDAVEQLHDDGVDVRFLVAGDGPLRDELTERARAVEARTGRPLVVLAGEVSDPAPAYAAADVMVGMGGSALRSMAFGKPLVVAGEQGFSELLTPESCPQFLRTGWYGTGPGTRGSGADAIGAALSELIGRPALRRQLGEFGRDLVVDRFGLTAAAGIVERTYRNACGSPARARPVVLDAARSAAGLTFYKVRRKIDRRRGTAQVDDANATPVAAREPTTRPTANRTSRTSVKTDSPRG